MPSKPLLLLDCYLDPDGADAFFAPWLMRAPRIRVEATVQSIPDRLSMFSGIVVTGSSASVYEEAPWSVAAVAAMGRALEDAVPILGVCYGHQLLGEAIAGRGTVRKAEQPEVGYHEVEILRGDPLFDCLPERFTSFMTHGDEVQASTAFQTWGSSAGCEVQALRVPGERAWGVQFHTEYPPEEQLRLLEMREDKHPELGLDARAMFAARVDTELYARAMFGRFLEICGW